MNLRKDNISKNYRLLIFLIAILLLFSFSSLLFIDNHSLVAHVESLYANRAKLIIDTNNWFTPFEKAHHKTIGSYWLIALSFKLFIQDRIIRQRNLLVKDNFFKRRSFIKKGLKIAPLGETLPKKHHKNFTLKDAKLYKSIENKLNI